MYTDTKTNPPSCPISVESAAAEIVGYDDVGDGVEDELNVVRVRRARLMTVDLLRRALVLRFELRLNVRRRVLERLQSCVFRKADC